METSLVDGHQIQDGDHSSTEIENLREEYQQLTEEFTKANEERAQAAKYGLHVLAEKQALQSKYVELNSLYEDTKLELDKSVEVSTMCAESYLVLTSIEYLYTVFITLN